MKSIKSLKSLICMLLFCMLCLSSCKSSTESWFKLPNPFPQINTSLHQENTYEVNLQGMTGAAMYNGEIYVCDKLSNNVTCYHTDFTPKRTIGKVGSHAGELLSPEGLWVDDDGVHVLNWGNKRIEHFDHDGTFIANYPITGTYSPLTIVGGLCRADGKYWISLSPDDSTCRLLTVSENGENKLLDAEGMGDFFVKDGIPYLLTQWGEYKEGRDNTLNSRKSGEIYQCNDQKLIKISGAYPGINPTPFVRLGNWYLSISRTAHAVCIYSQETNELLGYAMTLFNVGRVDLSNPGPLLDIRLLSDGQTLYFLWPADRKVYKWTRSET